MNMKEYHLARIVFIAVFICKSYFTFSQLNSVRLLSLGTSLLTPTLISPENGTNVNEFPTLSISVSDNTSTNLIVKFYARIVESTEKFTMIGFPDTQYYSSSTNGGTPAIINSQTQWVVSNNSALNIVYCAGLGDCVQNGDVNENEWQFFDTAMTYLEDPNTTNLKDGLPYGVAVGNHDQSPNGNPDGTTTYFNQYFGVNRFYGRNYYGGGYNGNDNHFDLFSAEGMDFIVIYFEYDTFPDSDVISWGENLLNTYSNRRAIIVSHWIINSGNPGSFGTPGQALYNAFKDNPNVFLMLCGHVDSEGRRTDTFNGHTIYSVLSDYQSRAHGGDGWLRIMEFDPVANLINFKTYSPYLDQYEQDDDSQFSLSYNMSDNGEPFNKLNSDTVENNSIASFQWYGLESGKVYQWYVTMEDDDANISTSPVWYFSTYDLPVVKLKCKVFLQGPNNNGVMTTSLNSQGFLPHKQPYNILPWNYPGTERVLNIPRDVVDWLLLELRNSTTEVAATRSTFLNNDGNIVDLDGISPVKFYGVSGGNYYIVIKHRNHLPIMSATPVPLSNDNTYDFTINSDQFYGGVNATNEIETGVWGMIAGDGNGNGEVQNDDSENIWKPDNGTSGYKNSDFNMNRQVQNDDNENYWKPNNGRGTQVPATVQNLEKTSQEGKQRVIKTESKLKSKNERNNSN